MSRLLNSIQVALRLVGMMMMLLSVPGVALAQETIKFGDLDSYNRYAAFSVPYRNGWQLAVDEINAKGGILGKKLVVVSRDDGGTPTDAIRAADELVSREGVQVLIGTFLSNISLAVSDYAKQKKVIFVPMTSGTDALSLEQGNLYTFHFRGNVYTYTNMLVEEAVKLGVKRWAIVAPNYEFGHSAAEAFKSLLKAKMPDAVIVTEQYPTLGKLDGGALVNALEEAKPDGIFNVLFGADVAQFARDGLSRGLFEKRTVLSIGTGYPEYLNPLKDQVPVGWITQGYAPTGITTPGHKEFVEAYQKRYNELPTAFSMMGYVGFMMMKDAVEKAGSTSPDALVKAMKGLKFNSIVGPLEIRAVDNKVTMGSWIGKLALKNGTGAFVDWSYRDGKQYMYPDDIAKARHKE
jgi:branched-chain amino acid transport system substrate-binding protein